MLCLRVDGNLLSGVKIDQSDSFRYPAGDIISPIKKPHGESNNLSDDDNLSIQSIISEN